MALERTRHTGRQLRRWLITGILTVIPLWITWWVFTFILNQLSRFGTPWVRAAGRAVEPLSPALSAWLLHPWFQFACAVLLTLAVLILLGWLTTRVLGRKLLEIVDNLIRRIPLAERIYGGTRKLISALQQQPEHVERVVMIPFPSEQMKVIGFVTRVFNDAETGRQLAAVYVPTTPNPTSGYLEIVPVEHVVSTDWSVDEAMSFIMTGGTVAPDKLQYHGESPQISPADPVDNTGAQTRGAHDHGE